MGEVQFRILGPVEAFVGGEPVDLGRPRQRALLALLLTRANTVLSVDRLVELLWGERSPASATTALQVYVSGLRRALEPGRARGGASELLVTRAPGYLLSCDPDDLDAARFEALASEGHRLLSEGDPGAARVVLAEALGLWRGPPLAEFSTAPFAQPESARLEELRAAALEDRLQADLDIGDNAGLIGELETLVRERPLRERLWGLLMVALYRADRQADALRAFSRARAELVEELGIEPGPSLRRLEADILGQDPALYAPSATAPEETAPSVAPPDLRAAPAVHGRRPDAGELVGRQRELAVLRSALSSAMAGRAQVALVSGEPGIGKTRLMEELAGMAHAAGAAVAWGLCREGQGTPSFWPWAQVLRDLLPGAATGPRAAWASGAAAIAHLVPEVADVVPFVPVPPVADATEARFQLYEAVVRVVEGQALTQPLVVVLEDVHWADVASLELVEFLAERVTAAPLLLACTYRNVDPTVALPLADTLGALARLRVHRVDLEGLGPDDVSLLIQQSGVELPPDAVVSVHTRTDGNPFFVTELARLLEARDDQAGGAAAEHGIPSGVRDVIRRRFARLSDRTQELLATAAVLGPEVDLRLVAAAAPGRDDVVELVDSAVAVGIFVPDTGAVGHHRFTHALVQETLYDQLAPGTRATLHARAAAAVHAVHGADGAHAVELADHLYQGAGAIGPSQGFEAALRAAEVAEQGLAYEQAEEQLRRALELVAMMPAAAERSYREIDVQHRLAALLSSIQGYHSVAVAAAWERARELAAELDDADQVLASLWGLARLARARGQYRLSRRLGEELLELARTTDTGAFFAAGHETCGMASLYLGDLADAEAHMSQVVALGEVRTVDLVANALVMNPVVVCKGYLAHVRWLAGDPAGAYALAASSIEIGKASGHPMTEALGLLLACVLAVMDGDADRAITWAGQVEPIAASGGIGPLAFHRVLFEAWGRIKRGDGDPLQEIEDMARAIWELRASGFRLAWTMICGAYADALRSTGDYDGAMAAVDEGLADVESRGETYCEAELCRLRGELLVARDPSHTAAARQWFERAAAVADRLGEGPFASRARASLDALVPSGPSRPDDGGGSQSDAR